MGTITEENNYYKDENESTTTPVFSSLMIPNIDEDRIHLFNNIDTEYYDNLWDWEVPETHTAPPTFNGKNKKRKENKWAPPRPKINTTPEVTYSITFNNDDIKTPISGITRSNSPFFSVPTLQHTESKSFLSLSPGNNKDSGKSKSPKYIIIINRSQRDSAKRKHRKTGGLLSYPLNSHVDIKKLGHLPINLNPKSKVRTSIKEMSKSSKHLLNSQSSSANRKVSPLDSNPSYFSSRRSTVYNINCQRRSLMRSNSSVKRSGPNTPYSRSPQNRLTPMRSLKQNNEANKSNPAV